MTALVKFTAKEVGNFGNTFLKALVNAESVKNDATRALQQVEEQETFLDFEFTRAALFLHEKEKVNLLKIYDNDKKATSILYRNILTHIGVLKRTVTEDDIVEYNFTDPTLNDVYYFDAALKEKDEAEYTRRRNRRNSLNIRMARVIKGAIALVDADASSKDLVYKKDEKTGNQVPVITKGPKEVLGKSEEVRIFAKTGSKQEGASYASTIGGLAKVADGKHKEKPTSSAETSSTTQKPGEGVVGESDFIATVNTLMSMVKGREGEFSDGEKIVLKNLLTTITNNGIK